MASELVKATVNSTWTDIAGAAASQAGVYWQNVGGLPLYLSFTTTAPDTNSGFVFLAPGLSFHDDTGSANVWAKCTSGVSTVTATLDPAAGGGGGGGGAGPTVTDYSAVLTGGNDTFVTAGQAAHYLAIQNPTSNANITINIAGGDSTTSGIDLIGGGSLTIDLGVANAVTIKGTAAQSVTVFAG